MLRSFLSRARLVAALYVLLSFFAASASAQQPLPLSGTQYGIGWVGNLPEMAAGGSAYFLVPRWGGIGLYVDAKFDIDDPSGENGFDPSVTGSQVANEVDGSAFIKTENGWWSANVAVLRPISPYFTAYVGGGITRVTPYQLFNVPLGTDVGFGGVVWAEDPDLAETRANFMFGMLTRLTGRVTAHFGYETQPRGVTAGLSLRLPRW